MKKLLTVSLLSLSVLGLSAQPAFASTSLLNDELDENYSDEIEVTPYVNWTGSAYLTTSAYSNVTSSNNIFNDSPKVTSDANNAGKIRVMIVNSKGAQVGKTKDVSPGKSVRMDQIPWNSGTYTLKAKALSKSGTYRIGID